tara:strand:- start:4299 stop:5789 length:1491 start_codon:yes stop_codon:yes gene_type:complete
MFIIDKETIKKEGYNSDKCIKKEDLNNNKVDNKSDTINLDSLRENDVNSYKKLSNIKSCEDTDYEGCCWNPSDSNKKCDEGHETGIKYEIVGDDGKLWTGEFCHSDKVQDIYKVFDDPNHMVKFFKLIGVSILTLLVTATIGTCYEFWLRYGDAKKCIYYKSNCDGRTEISLVDYMFPKDISTYPYQKCSKAKTTQRGGSKTTGIISNFPEYESLGAKCINLDYDTTIFSEKPFPYNIADYAIDYTNSETIKVLAKTISFYFLFTVWTIRQVKNFIFRKLSSSYQKGVENNPILGNLCFLLLTGLIFPIIAYFTSNSSFGFGPFFIVVALVSLISIISSFGPIIGLFHTCFSPKYLYNYPNIDENYYRIISLESFKKLIFYKDKDNVINVVKAIFFVIPVIILYLFSIGLGSIISALAGLFMSLSVFFKLFLIPLTNPLECLSILKSHGDLLTILFCMGIIGSAANSLDPTTTGIMSMVLGIIIIFKILNGIKSSV